MFPQNLRQVPFNRLGVPALSKVMRKVVVSFGFLFLTAVAAVAQSDIHTVDFKNFTYHPYCISEQPETVWVKNGEYSKSTQMDGYVDRYSFNVFAISYGDLNGDGKDEATILTVCNTGGTGNFSEGFVYTMKAGKPVLMANIPGGDRAAGGLRSAKVENGLLVIDANEETEDSGACCPQSAAITRYKISGGKLVAVGEPEHHDLFPTERVKFDRGMSGSTFKVRIPFEEGRRYVLGASAGQTLTVSVNKDKASIRLLEEDVNATNGTNNLTARLPKSGDYTIEIQNDADTEIEVTVSIKIR
jgi:hypothetical protein